MESIQHILFENPLAAYVLLALAEALLAWLWYTRRDRRLLWGLAGVPAMVGILALTSWLVVTDRERIYLNLQEIARGITDNDFSAARRHVHPACTAPTPAGPLDKDSLLRAGQEVVNQYPVRQIKLNGIDTIIAGDNATCTFGSKIHLQGFLLDYVDVGWKIQWSRFDGQWLISRVEITYPGNLRSFRPP